MRESRGLRKDAKGWVYGFYAHIPRREGLQRLIIDPTKMHVIIDDDGEYAEVIPETVGQYVATINGLELYSGDRLQCGEDSFTAVVVFDELGLLWSAQLYLNGELNESMSLRRYLYSRERAAKGKMRVIGNVHENPELLED